MFLRTPSFWTLDRIADALANRTARSVTPGATPRGPTVLHAISTDTRSVLPGDCFVALVGEKFDGHDFLESAVAAGATAVVVSRPPALGTLNVPVFVVDDTLLALGDLARCWRRAWGRPVIAIAGSNGKTSTKELVRAALGTVYHVHATTGNLNNRIGVPLTLLAVPPSAEVAVIEMGTSLPGEIAALLSITEPEITVMTCVAEEHLEGLGDLAGVLREESDAFNDVPLAIVPSIQPEVVDEARRRAWQVVTAGLEQGEVHATSWTIDAGGRATIVLDDISFTPPLRGAHNARNTMLAIAVAQACGVSPADATRGIAAMSVPPMRTAWHAIGRATVIHDAYNANPASTLAALEMLSGTNASQRVAILGTMRELGPNAPRYHDDVARAALATKADIIAGIGEFADALQRVAPTDQRVVTAPDIDELWPLLTPRLVPDATILLKASRGVRLERLLPTITSWATT